MREFWISVGFPVCQGSEYSRISIMLGFWISRVTQGLPIFVNMTGFWVYMGMQLLKGSEYSRIPNKPGFCLCKRYTRLWISLNMDEQCLNKLFWLWQGFEYARLKFHWDLNKPPILNMPVLRIWQGCEYKSVTQGAEYVWISLNML